MPTQKVLPKDRPKLLQIKQGDKEGSTSSQPGDVHTTTGQDPVLHICDVSKPVEHNGTDMHACMLKLHFKSLHQEANIAAMKQTTTTGAS